MEVGLETPPDTAGTWCEERAPQTAGVLSARGHSRRQARAYLCPNLLSPLRGTTSCLHSRARPHHSLAHSHLHLMPSLTWTLSFQPDLVFLSAKMSSGPGGAPSVPAPAGGQRRATCSASLTGSQQGAEEQPEAFWEEPERLSFSPENARPKSTKGGKQH